MKTEKQELLLRILETGKYMISVDDGGIYSWRAKLKRYEPLVPTILKTGFLQYNLFLGRKQKLSLRVYGHHVVWISVNGPFAETDLIIHGDADRSNNGAYNLDKIENFVGEEKEETLSGLKLIRHKEIKDIRYMVEMGEHNQSKISKDLGLNRLSVRRVMKKIEKGEILKYENRRTRI